MIGEDIPPEMQPAVEAMRGMCGRALEKLGKDLYSHESQFFHELLQTSKPGTYIEFGAGDGMYSVGWGDGSGDVGMTCGAYVGTCVGAGCSGVGLGVGKGTGA